MRPRPHWGQGWCKGGDDIIQSLLVLSQIPRLFGMRQSGLFTGSVYPVFRTWRE
jgi:hypothetical protein